MLAASPVTPGSTPPRPAMQILQVVSGNFLEMYDFMVYGFYATALSHAFFPSKDPYFSLMLTLAGFGASFLMRPLGALLLGAYIDHHGRRQGLFLTLGMMSVGILVIALTPDYAHIGLWAPILVLMGRLLQSFSAGVELGGVSVYLAEIAPPGRLGFYVSWQSASQQVAALFAAAVGLGLHAVLSHAAIDAWGWRIPFLIGCFIVPLLLLLRHTLQETPAFQRQRRHPELSEIMASVRQHIGLILGGTGMVTMTTVSFYLISTYMPTYGQQALHLSAHASFLVTAVISLSNFIWLPLMGALSDRIGRAPLLITASALALCTAWGILHWVTEAPSMLRLLVAGLWLSCLYSSYNGALVVALTEVMPAELRATGFSLAYSLATATMGGFTPLVCTWLIRHYHNTAAPALWLSLAALIGLISSLVMYRNGPKPRGRNRCTPEAQSWTGLAGGHRALGCTQHTPPRASMALREIPARTSQHC